MRRRRPPPSPPVRGGLDRAGGALCTGWLWCETCPPGHPVQLCAPSLSWTSPAIPQSLPRPDCPGGQGFAVRPSPLAPWATATVTVTVACTVHPEQAVVREVDASTWNVRLAGALESCTSRGVTGWVTDLGAPRRAAHALVLHVDGTAWSGVTDGVRPATSPFLGGAVAATFDWPRDLKVGGLVELIDPPTGAVVASRQVAASDPAAERPAPSRGLDTALTSWAIDGHVEAGLVDRLVHLGHDRPQALAFAALAGQGPRASLLDACRPALTHADLEAVYRSALTGEAKSGRALEPSLARELTHWLHGQVPRREGAEPQTGSPEASVAVAGLVGHRSGVGRNAELSLEALALAGIDARSVPLSLAPDLAPRHVRPSPWPCAQTVLHWPIDELATLRLRAPWLWETDVLHALCLWETAEIPVPLQAQLALPDRVWAPSRFVAEALQPYARAPVEVVPHAVDVSEVAVASRQELGLPEDAFVVHFSFDANSTAARKNPAAVLRAVQLAFGDDPEVRVLIKVRHAEQLGWLAESGCADARALLTEAAADSRVAFLFEERDRAATLGLIAASDCYLSLHRSEGFGYTLAEAMALGTPTIATGWSGNTDFMDDTTGWLVSSQPRHLLPGQYFHWSPGMQWAEPDLEAAAAALREVRHGGPAVRLRVEAALTRMQDFTVSRMAEAYARALDLPCRPATEG